MSNKIEILIPMINNLFLLPDILIVLREKYSKKINTIIIRINNGSLNKKKSIKASKIK